MCFGGRRNAAGLEGGVTGGGRCRPAQMHLHRGLQHDARRPDLRQLPRRSRHEPLEELKLLPIPSPPPQAFRLFPLNPQFPNFLVIPRDLVNELTVR